jgi:hypothetical protein
VRRYASRRARLLCGAAAHPVQELSLIRTAARGVSSGAHSREPTLPARRRWAANDAQRYLIRLGGSVSVVHMLDTDRFKLLFGPYRPPRYDAIWHGQKAYNGMAILARGCKPRELRRGLPGDPDDHASRYLEAEVGGLTIGCLYLRNANSAPGQDALVLWDRLLVRSPFLRLVQ